MEKRNYNPLNEGYNGSNIDLEGYKGTGMDGYSAKKGYSGNTTTTTQQPPQKISYNIQSGVIKPTNNSNNG